MNKIKFMDNTKKEIIITALSYIGTKGIQGQKSNPTILDFFKKSFFSGVQNDDVAWCSAFVNAICSILKLPMSYDLLARSWLNVGIETKKPEMGDLAIFWRGSKNASTGHVGFFIGEFNDSIYVLGGNQNNEVNISLFPKYQLLGYRSLIIK